MADERRAVRFFWTVLMLSSSASVAGNVAHAVWNAAAPAVVVAAVAALVPPLALLARFEELRPHAPRLENAASQLTERFLAHFAAHNWEAMAEMLAANVSSDDRRRVVGAESNTVEMSLSPTCESSPTSRGPTSPQPLLRAAGDASV